MWHKGRVATGIMEEKKSEIMRSNIQMSGYKNEWDVVVIHHHHHHQHLTLHGTIDEVNKALVALFSYFCSLIWNLFIEFHLFVCLFLFVYKFIHFFL